jgi:hypothetical protein
MKTVSTEYIINKVIKDFKITDTSWIGDAVDWVGDAIESIGYHCGLTTYMTEPLKVVNHTVELPCNLVTLKGVYHDGVRLVLGSDLTGSLKLHDYSSSNLNDTISDEDFITLQRLYVQKNVIDAIVSPTAQDLLDREDVCKQIEALTSCKKLSNSAINHCVLPYYNLKPNFIQTSFADGYIQILHAGFTIDENGFPAILDTFKYREAVMWRVLRGTCLQGYIHPTIDFKMADDLFEKYRFQASNEQKMPSLDNLERFTNRWLSVKRGISFSNSFSGAEQPQGTIY